MVKYASASNYLKFSDINETGETKYFNMVILEVILFFGGEIIFFPISVLPKIVVSQYHSNMVKYDKYGKVHRKSKKITRYRYIVSGNQGRNSGGFSYRSFPSETINRAKIS